MALFTFESIHQRFPFANYLAQKQHPFTAITSLPFTWERNRRKLAQQVFPSLQALPQFHALDLNELAAEEENKKLKLNGFFQLAADRCYELFLQHTT